MMEKQRPALVVLASPYRCAGECGDGEVCAEIVLVNGYCLKPQKRQLTVTVEQLSLDNPKVTQWSKW